MSRLILKQLLQAARDKTGHVSVGAREDSSLKCVDLTASGNKDVEQLKQNFTSLPNMNINLSLECKAK